MTEMSGSINDELQQAMNEAAEIERLIDAEMPADRIGLLQRLRAIQAKQAALKERYEQIRDAAVAALGEETVLVEDPQTGEKLVALKREDEILEVNLAVIREELGEEAVNAVTKQVVDRAKFERAVQKQIIPGDVVAKAAKYKPKTPFVQFAPPKDEADGFDPAY